MNLAETRAVIAGAVTASGAVKCLPYKPDTVAAPLAWVDSITLGADAAAAFRHMPAAATVLLVEQRHDLPEAIARMESAIGPAVAALEALRGLLVEEVSSSFTDIGGQTVPATAINVRFHLALAKE